MTKQKDNPRVGIFMPAYNQGPYIDEAIDSLKKQTFQDFEVAIVDDFSSDGITRGILKKITYNKAKVYLEQKNRGVGIIARKYYKKLNNEYIFVLCGDDKIEPTYIEECVNYLDQHLDTAAVATWIQCFGANNDLIKLDIKKATLPHALVESHYLGSAVMRREAFEQIGFGLSLRRQNDYDRWVSMMENGWKLAIIEKPLFLYRQLQTSLSHTMNIGDELEFRELFLQRHKKLFDEHYPYVILELYKQVFEMRNWQQELTTSKNWLAEKYEELSKENKQLKNDLETANTKLRKIQKIFKPAYFVYKKLFKK